MALIQSNFKQGDNGGPGQTRPADYESYLCLQHTPISAIKQ